MRGPSSVSAASYVRAPAPRSNSRVTLCALPKVACVYPACGAIGGGGTVTLHMAHLDRLCLGSSQPPLAPAQPVGQSRLTPIAAAAR